MPTVLSRFFRGRSPAAAAPDGVTGLRIVEALLRQPSPARRHRLAVRVLRRGGFRVALVVATRVDGGGEPQTRVLAGDLRGAERGRLREALASRLSPLRAEPLQAPFWTSVTDDPFRPGVAFLRKADLGCALVLPLPPDGLAEGEYATLLLAAPGPLPRDGALVQQVLAGWALYGAALAAGEAARTAGRDPAEGGPAMEAVWDAAPTALVLVDGDEVTAANAAAEQLLRASFGAEGRTWPLWLVAAVRRLDDAGTEREKLLASRARDLTLEVAIGGRVTGRGGRPGRVIAVRDATAEVQADNRSAEAISTISHELRTPLTSMKNSVGLLLRGDAGALTPQSQHFLGMTMRNIDRLNRLIGDLLDVSRAGAGRRDLHRQTVDLVPLLREALELFAATARQRRIDLGCDCGAERFPAHVDPDKVVQMLHNTVGNALKYTPEGGRVRAWLNPRPGSGTPADARAVAERYFLPLRTFALVVEDNGVGMDEELRRTLFQPFARGRGADDGSAPGSGLGLHITRTLVEAHGGVISVESSPGAGTTVWIVLPRDPESERVLVAVRRLRRGGEAAPRSRLAFLDTRGPGSEPEPAELRRAARVVRDFIARLDQKAEAVLATPASAGGVFALAADAGGDGVEEPAPGLWAAVVADWPRLATAWEVERARPGAPVLLQHATWELPELETAPVAGAAAQRADVAVAGEAAPETEGI